MLICFFFSRYCPVQYPRPAPTDCLEEGVAYSGEQTAFYPKTADECMRRLVRKLAPQRYWFSHNASSKTCEIFSEVVTRTKVAGWVSGPSICHSQCYELETVITSNTMPVASNYSSAACQSQCQRDPTCQSFSYSLQFEQCILSTDSFAIATKVYECHMNASIY